VPDEEIATRFEEELAAPAIASAPASATSLAGAQTL